MEAGQSDPAGKARSLEPQGGARTAGHGWRPFTQRRPVLALLMSSAGWEKPTHILKGKQLYSKSTYFNVNLIPNPPPRNIQNNMLPNIWAPWPGQVGT